MTQFRKVMLSAITGITLFTVYALQRDYPIAPMHTGSMTSGGETTRYEEPFPAVVEVVQFSPDCEADVPIAILLGKAKESVLVSIFSFSSEEIASHLAEVLRRVPGVEMKVLVDSTQSSRYLLEEGLRDMGAEVQWDKSSGYHHNKVIIVDHQLVLTGSMNFSKNGQCRNRENYLILNSEKLADIYEERFRYLWETYGKEEVIDPPKNGVVEGVFDE